MGRGIGIIVFRAEAQQLAGLLLRLFVLWPESVQTKHLHAAHCGTAVAGYLQLALRNVEGARISTDR